jgi:mandelamide amidase
MECMDRSIAELAQMVRKGKITARALVEEALEKATAAAALNAFITLDSEGAVSDAGVVDAMVANGEVPGPLAGVPIAVKDNINVAGFHTTAGTPGIDYAPKSSAPVIARLRAAHAIIIGKTNMHELAFGVTSHNAAFGAVRNAVDPACIPGGSSGGTATAIAAGIVSAGLGTDTAGSVRLPAALSGVVGFRPTSWRVDRKGVVPSVPTFDVVGPMARTVADAALLHAVMTNSQMPERRDLNGLRLGVARPHSDDVSPAVAGTMDAAYLKLRRAGATLVDIDMSSVVTACFEIGYPIGFYEMGRGLRAFLAENQPLASLEQVVDRIAGQDVKAIYANSVLGDDAPTETAYREAIGRIEQIRQDYLNILASQKIDAVIFPTAPLEAQPIEGSAETVILNGRTVPTTPTFIRNTASTGVYGAPGISIPLRTDALPVGLELDGRPDGDLDLLSIGIAVEAALAAD